MNSLNNSSFNKKENLPNEGIRRLTASAALIMVALVGGLDQEKIRFLSPELRVTPAGDIEAWLVCDNGSSADLFKAWPNKFAQLAFGFACDHFKMLYSDYWQDVSKRSLDERKVLVLGSEFFDLGPGIKLENTQPERLTAPALMEMCKRMATTPGWIMKALEDLERGVPIVSQGQGQGPKRPRSSI